MRFGHSELDPEYETDWAVEDECGNQAPDETFGIEGEDFESTSGQNLARADAAGAVEADLVRIDSSQRNLSNDNLETTRTSKIAQTAGDTSIVTEFRSSSDKPEHVTDNYDQPEDQESDYPESTDPPEDTGNDPEIDSELKNLEVLTPCDGETAVLDSADQHVEKLKLEPDLPKADLLRLAKTIETGVLAGTIIDIADAKKDGSLPGLRDHYKAVRAARERELICKDQNKKAKELTDAEKDTALALADVYVGNLISYAEQYFDFDPDEHRQELSPQRRIDLEAIAAEAGVGPEIAKQAGIMSPEIRAALQHLADQAIEARNEIHVRTGRWAVGIAWSYRSMAEKNGVAFGDVIGAAHEGLLHAIEKYDYKTGNTITHYSKMWISQSIIKMIQKEARLIQLPTNIEEKLTTIYKYTRENTTASGPPSNEAIAAHAKISVSQLNELRRLAMRPISLNKKVGEEEEDKDDGLRRMLNDAMIASKMSAEASFALVETAMHDRPLRDVKQQLGKNYAATRKLIEHASELLRTELSAELLRRRLITADAAAEESNGSRPTTAEE